MSKTSRAKPLMDTTTAISTVQSGGLGTITGGNKNINKSGRLKLTVKLKILNTPKRRQKKTYKHISITLKL